MRAPTNASLHHKAAESDILAGLERLLDAAADRPMGDVLADLVAYAAAIGLDACDTAIDGWPGFAIHRAHLTQRFWHYVHEREVTEVAALNARALPPGMRYRDVAGEFATANYNWLREALSPIDMNAVTRAVVVGCGWRPVTSFHIHDETTIPEVIGLDVRAEAVDSARRLAARFGCDRLRFETADAQCYDFSGAQLVHVASMVSPKAAVLRQILDTAPRDVCIVLWEPVALGRLWMETVTHPLTTDLEEISRTSLMRLSTQVCVRRAPHAG